MRLPGTKLAAEVAVAAVLSTDMSSVTVHMPVFMLDIMLTPLDGGGGGEFVGNIPGDRLGPRSSTPPPLIPPAHSLLTPPSSHPHHIFLVLPSPLYPGTFLARSPGHSVPPPLGRVIGNTWAVGSTSSVS